MRFCFSLSERMNEKREDVSAQGRTHSSSVAVNKADSCAVCTTTLTSRAEPKLLPCLHMLCKACLVNITEEKHAKECPLCGQYYNLSEVTDCFIFEESAPKCGGCDDPALSGWCKECEEALCSDCVSAHQRVKVTRNHTVIPQEPQSGLCTSLRCTSHKQEQLKFFCVTCDQLTCRDCQLIDHRNHSFLLVEEAVVSQKDQLMKLLDSLREEKTSMRARLQDLDERLNDIKEWKSLSEKQLEKVLRSIYSSFVLRCRQLSTELEGLCNEEEKSLNVMKTSLKKLENSQEHITAFIHKILSTEGLCILRHKVQIEKWVQRVLSQKKVLPDTVIQISLLLKQDICHIIKNFASFKVTRVPLSTKGKYKNGNKPKNADKSAATSAVSDTTPIQATARPVNHTASALPQPGQSESASSRPVQPTQHLTDSTRHASSSFISHTFAPLQTTQSNTAQIVVAQGGQHSPRSISPQPSQSQQFGRSLSHPIQATSLSQSCSVSGQTVLNIIPSNLPQHGIVMPQVMLPQSQTGSVLAAAATGGHASSPSVTHPSVSVHTASVHNNLTNTQSHTLANNQPASSLFPLASFAQSSQSISNPHPFTYSTSSNHTQQSFPQATSNPYPSTRNTTSNHTQQSFPQAKSNLLLPTLNTSSNHTKQSFPQAMSNPHPSTLDNLSNHTQQSFPQATSNPHPSTPSTTSNHTQQSFSQTKSNLLLPTLNTSSNHTKQSFSQTMSNSNPSTPSTISNHTQQSFSQTMSNSNPSTQSPTSNHTQQSFSQALTNLLLRTLNTSSNHTQQSISQSQAVSGQSFPSQIIPTNKSMLYSLPVSTTQSVSLQPTQSAGLQSNHLQLTVLQVPNNVVPLDSRKAWKFYNYTPALTGNKLTTLTCVPQPKKHIRMGDKRSSNPTLGKVPCPQASRLSDPTVSSNKELDPPVSSMPPLPAAPIPRACSNAGQIECATRTVQMPPCELPVKAPADSVCEGDIDVCRWASPVAEETDSNLPTSTVPEKDTKAEELSAIFQPLHVLSTTAIEDCPPNQTLLTQYELPVKRISTLSAMGSPSTKHWLTGLPSSLKEVLCSEIKVPPEDSCSRAALEHTSLSDPEDDEKTDDSDCELEEGMDESEDKPIFRQDCNNTLLVSLLRLPISGSSLSKFQIVPSSQKSEILLQEIEENQAVRKCFRIPATPVTTSSSPSCSSEDYLQADVLDCAVCLSAGASLQCAECSRSFHTSCHVPPILFNPIAMWVCSLCQDVLDDTDPFSCDRLKEPYLSLSDQRRCEQLLLTLMCANHSYLLYKTIKQTAGCVEFNLIVGRLLGKCSPPYRSAAEMVSDIWALFDNLSSNAKKKDLVIELQSSFQERLNVSFGKSLHASLLRPLRSGDQTGAPETESDGEKAKNTLKRMRAFLAAKCPPVAKKAHTENTQR